MYYTPYSRLFQSKTGGHFISYYFSCKNCEIMRIIVCNNRYNRSLPSKNRTLYFTLFHLFLLLLLLSQLYTLFHVTHYDTESNNTNMQCAGMAVAPRVSCCRREEDATLARAVNDNDLVLWGSAHGVPRDVGCRR
jgi:hypothetical protein